MRKNTAGVKTCCKLFYLICAAIPLLYNSLQDISISSFQLIPQPPISMATSPYKPFTACNAVKDLSLIK